MPGRTCRVSSRDGDEVDLYLVGDLAGSPRLERPDHADARVVDEDVDRTVGNVRRSLDQPVHLVRLREVGRERNRPDLGGQLRTLPCSCIYLARPGAPSRCKNELCVVATRLVRPSR
jgi:hypothetical protein